MSIKQNFPTIDPTLNLDFANSRAVDSRITFTRASAATHTDALGILQTVRDNKPRIDFDANTGECRGLLIEEQRTNLLTYSNNPNLLFDGGAAAVSISNVMSPDGNMSAYNITTTGTSNNSLWRKTGPITFTAATVTLSCYAKPIGANNWLVWSFQNMGGAVARFGFNLSGSGSTSIITSGNGGHTLSIQALPNGWYRCIIIGNAQSSGGTTQYFYTGVAAGESSPGIVGDGVSVFGFQLENGAFATSYVPSNTTFTSRASSATYFDAAGVLRTAPANGARYGYGYDSVTGKWVTQGLVLEAAATNSIAYSSNFENAAWITGAGTKPTVTSGYLAPDGTMTAMLVTPANTTYSRLAQQFTLPASTTLTFSIFVKAGNKTNLQFFTSQANYTTFVVDLTTGTIGSLSGATYNLTGKTTKLNDSWYRVEYTITNSTASNITETIAMAWDGLAATQTNYIWGAQLETGAVATSYIPTYGATATRAADVSTSAATTRANDVAKITGNAFSNFYRMDESTLYAEASSAKLSDTISESVVAFDPGQNTPSMHLYNGSLGGGNSNAFGLYSGGLSNGVTYKFATTFKYMDYATVWNGGSVITNTVSTATVTNKPTQLFIGSDGISGFLNGHIKKFAYYPKRLSNTQLQALTV